jgi:MFS family permease
MTPKIPVTTNGAWRSAGVLFVAWILAFIDRSIIVVLVPGIKKSLDLTDTQVSLLHGMAFALFFSFAGLAFGKIVDRGNRRMLILVGLIGWSLASVVCGLATSFEALFAARLAVGVFQAVLAPASFSIIADLFVAERRGKPTAMLIAAGSVGTNLAIMIGGLLVAAFTAWPLVLPAVGKLAPWQATLMAISLPGFIAAIFVARLKEPERQRSPINSSHANFRLLPHLRRNPFVFALMFTAFACNFLLAYGLTAWFPTLLMRSLRFGPAETGLALGSLKMSAALLAGFGGGIIIDAYAARDPAGGRLRLVRLLLSLEAAAVLPLVFQHSLIAVLAAIFATSVLVTVGSSVVYAALPDYVPAEGRGQIIAVEQFISSLVGLGLGPTLIAIVTDNVFGDESKVHLSLLTVGVCVAGLGAVAATLALPGARRLHDNVSREGKVEP